MFIGSGPGGPISILDRARGVGERYKRERMREGRVGIFLLEKWYDKKIHLSTLIYEIKFISYL